MQFNQKQEFSKTMKELVWTMGELLIVIMVVYGLCYGIFRALEHYHVI